MNVHFQKNVFFGNEIANCTVSVDNHECKLRVEEVEFQVVQKMTLQGHRHWGGSFDVIENKDKTGIAPLQTEVVTKIMQLNLDTIKYIVEATRSKKKIPRAPEELFMLSNLAPACHSAHIKNDYFLNVNVKYDGCTCCSSLPNISIPLTVIPMTHMDTYGF